MLFSAVALGSILEMINRNVITHYWRVTTSDIYKSFIFLDAEGKTGL